MKILKYTLALLLLFILFVVVRGLLTPSINYSTSITVDKSVQDVWAVLNDESSLGQWLDGYVKTEHISGTKNTVGAVSNIYMLDPKGNEMMMQETLKEIIPNKKVAMHFTMGPMIMDYDMTLETVGAQTKVTSNTVTSGTGLMRLMTPFMKGGMKTNEDKNMASLKRVIEGK